MNKCFVVDHKNGQKFLKHREQEKFSFVVQGSNLYVQQDGNLIFELSTWVEGVEAKHIFKDLPTYQQHKDWLVVESTDSQNQALGFEFYDLSQPKDIDNFGTKYAEQSE